MVPGSIALLGFLNVSHALEQMHARPMCAGSTSGTIPTCDKCKGEGDDKWCQKVVTEQEEDGCKIHTCQWPKAKEDDMVLCSGSAGGTIPTCDKCKGEGDDKWCQKVVTEQDEHGCKKHTCQWEDNSNRVGSGKGKGKNKGPYLKSEDPIEQRRHQANSNRVGSGKGRGKNKGPYMKSQDPIEQRRPPASPP